MRSYRALKIVALAAAVAASLVGTATAASASASTSVSTPTVALSTNAPGATATYTIQFRATSGLTPGSSSVTLNTASGAFPSGSANYTVGAQGRTAVVTVAPGFFGPAVQLTVPTLGTLAAVSPNAIVTVTVTGVVNAGAGAYSMSVSTSDDQVAATSASYTIGTATQLVASGGNNQTAAVGTQFLTHLGASLKDAANAPVLQAGVPVTFTAPSTCASGTFLTGGTNSTTVNTTASGIATASFFSANGIAGTYTVTATTAGLPVATFTETNSGTSAPCAPAIGTATAGDGSATVTWSAPASNGNSAITGYTVTASPGGASATAAGSATSVVVPGLTNGTAYTFKVTASNGVGPSGVSAASNAVTPEPPGPVTSPSDHGYWLVGGDGGIFTFGSANFWGSTGSLKLSRPVVGITPTQSRQGYWLDASDGGIFAFGDAGFYGSIPGLGILPAGYPGGGRKLAAPVVGMVPSADGGGYFMVAADGGVFAFGDAVFAGSCPAIGGCAGAAVAVMPDATGNGYWLVTATGHVYAFGDAPVLGSPGAVSSPVTSAVRTHDGNGYWILLANGTVLNFGDAAGLGGPVGHASGLNPATAIFATATGGGYWVALADGSVYSYGDAPFDGGMNGNHLNAPIIAGTGW
jgi:Fibronectin type III domain